MGHLENILFHDSEAKRRSRWRSPRTQRTSPRQRSRTNPIRRRAMLRVRHHRHRPLAWQRYRARGRGHPSRWGRRARRSRRHATHARRTTLRSTRLPFARLMPSPLAPRRDSRSRRRTSLALAHTRQAASRRPRAHRPTRWAPHPNDARARPRPPRDRSSSARWVRPLSVSRLLT